MHKRLSPKEKVAHVVAFGHQTFGFCCTKVKEHSRGFGLFEKGFVLSSKSEREASQVLCYFRIVFDGDRHVYEGMVDSDKANKGSGGSDRSMETCWV